VPISSSFHGEAASFRGVGEERTCGSWDYK